VAKISKRTAGSKVVPAGLRVTHRHRRGLNTAKVKQAPRWPCSVSAHRPAGDHRGR